MSRTKYFTTWFVIVSILLSAFTGKVAGQEIVRDISLNEAIAAALNNNKDIHLARIDQNIAAINFKKTTAIFLPQVSLSYTGIRTNDPLNAFGFKLEQRTITQNDFNPALLNNPNATSDYMTKLEVQQPLVNIDMLYQRMGAKKQTEAYQYKTQRTKEYLTFEVQKAYLQLQLAYDALKVLEEALQTAKSVYAFTDNHFKQGLIQKSDLLNAKVHITSVESSQAKAQSGIKNASDYLSLLMGQPSGTIYKPHGELQAQPAALDSGRYIYPGRSDFMAIQKAIEASDLMIKSSQMSYLPRLNAFGNYQYNDSRITGFGANSYFFGVQLSWNIFTGNKTKNAIAMQKSERDKLVTQLAQQKEQSQTDLDKAYRDLSDARFEIQQGKEAVEQATESLRILQNRYNQGLVNTTDVLMAETQLSQLKFSLAQAQFSSNVTMAYIQFLTSTTNK
ncbi:TolC family protein [Chitinophaga sp. Ak27]|uniref:TolC family protein n=1 Tax=Chitinophaga sp. Ak27 TaxID=2726116 RepID=UPI00145DA0E8|nr:TolC family protein [Chitinophaga sp. Ak27]NLU90696.1 TolC family protein [Chitinophaga sp. Ak27]